MLASFAGCSELLRRSNRTIEDGCGGSWCSWVPMPVVRLSVEFGIYHLLWPCRKERVKHKILVPLLHLSIVVLVREPCCRVSFFTCPGASAERSWGGTQCRAKGTGPLKGRRVQDLGTPLQRWQSLHGWSDWMKWTWEWPNLIDLLLVVFFCISEFQLLLRRTMHEHVEVPGRTMTDSESGTVAGNVQLHSPCFAFHDFLVPLAPCRSSEYFLRNLSRSFFFLLSLSLFLSIVLFLHVSYCIYLIYTSPSRCSMCRWMPQRQRFSLLDLQR